MNNDKNGGKKSFYLTILKILMVILCVFIFCFLIYKILNIFKSNYKKEDVLIQDVNQMIVNLYVGEEKILNLAVNLDNATNKKLTWTSSDTSVATVDNNGVVSLVGLGDSIITVTTQDGNYQATYKITVKKKNIIVITASLGLRMRWWFNEYTSANGYYYNGSINYIKVNDSFCYSAPNDNATLNYVFWSGKGYDFQVNEGMEAAMYYFSINSLKKEYIENFIFFTMPGNTAKNYTCDQLVSSTIYNDWSKGYSNAIQTIKNQGYTVKGYIVSHPPLQTSHNNANSQKIVYSNDENACASGYRSNWKYHLSNNKMKSVLDNNSNLTFIDNRSNYIIISDIENKEFTWLRNYTTADALHWDKTTTIDYMTLLFNKAGM